MAGDDALGQRLAASRPDSVRATCGMAVRRQRTWADTIDRMAFGAMRAHEHEASFAGGESASSLLATCVHTAIAARVSARNALRRNRRSLWLSGAGHLTDAYPLVTAGRLAHDLVVAQHR